MFRIKTFNKIASIGTNNFDKSKYQISNDVENPDAILVRSANMLDMEIPKSLKAIARAGVGVNNIPIERCSQNGIVVFNTPGANANAVKELAIAALLLSSRDIIGGVNWVRQFPADADIAKEVENGKKAFTGPELYGKKLGVFGLGAIGSTVANTATELGMDVYGFDPYLTVENAWMIYHSVKRAADPKVIFENCDYISLHIPSTQETRGFINAKVIDMIKKGVRIINLSRGDLVDLWPLKVVKLPVISLIFHPQRRRKWKMSLPYHIWELQRQRVKIIVQSWLSMSSSIIWKMAT
jgi:D-3-phosphoglycerate dehydrogenase